MGNARSVATIEIHVESEGKGHGVVTAGTTLKGEVIIQSKQAAVLSAVALSFCGKEISTIQTRIPGRASQSERSLIVLELMLQSLKENHGPDDVYSYKFPFAIPLPESLPSSDKFSLRNGSNRNFEISYHLLAKVEELETNRPLWILSAPLPKEPVPCMIRPIIFPIRAMKLFPAGQLTLGASLVNSNVGRGEELELNLVFRNESSIAIRSVDIIIIEHLRWNTVGKRHTVREINRTLLSVKNVAKSNVHLGKRTKKQPKSRDLNDNHFVKSINREIYTELIARNDPIRITVPETARDTYEGQLAQIWHRMQVHIQTNSISTNVTAILPLRIGTPTKLDKPKMPPGDERRAPQLISETAVAEWVYAGYPAPSAPPFDADNTPPATPITKAKPMFDTSTTYATQEEQAMLINATPGKVLLRACAVDMDDDGKTQGSSGDSSGSISTQTALQSVDSNLKVTLGLFLAQMEASVNDFELISKLLKEQLWVELLGNITATDYGNIVARVKYGGDQPRVASLLATYVLNGKLFLCEYAAVAIQKTCEWYRAITAQRLIPLCSDIAEKNTLIRAVLNEWELTILADNLEEAILSAPSIGNIAGGGGNGQHKQFDYQWQRRRTQEMASRLNFFEPFIIGSTHNL